MSDFDYPCFSLAIDRLHASETNHFASWVVQSPYPGGYVHHDCPWPGTLSQSWQAWLEMFSPHSLPHLSVNVATDITLETAASDSDQMVKSYSSRLMQHMGISLWRWLFRDSIQLSFHRSQGIALGQDQPLRVRLDLRAADLIPLPWEIMQPKPGQPAISLSQHLLFSRTTSEVNPLPSRFQLAQSLNILLVIGQPTVPSTGAAASTAVETLQLEQEAHQIQRVLQRESSQSRAVNCQVTTLIQPTVAELMKPLRSGEYNVFFYAGHGIPAPDGGLLFLRPGVTLNGTELSQMLVQGEVTLAVFNACWGAQPATEAEYSLLSLSGTPPDDGQFPAKLSTQPISQAIPGSSLAKVLIHHGVPAVLGMRDSITDQEALSFIHALSEALTERRAIDQAVAIARQQLLTLYKFNQPAWTLPVLYMHPEFNGELIHPAEEIRTELPANSQTWIGHSPQRAWLRAVNSALSNSTPPNPSAQTTERLWPINIGSVRVGRHNDNDIVIPEQWVSGKHAEIYCRNGQNVEPAYFLRDFSRYGTLIRQTTGWQRVHHEEITLKSGTHLKFGSSHGQTLEFIVEIL